MTTLGFVLTKGFGARLFLGQEQLNSWSLCELEKSLHPAKNPLTWCFFSTLVVIQIKQTTYKVLINELQRWVLLLLDGVGLHAKLRQT